MIAPTISAYLCFVQLPELKNITRKGVTAPRKQPRYDLVSMAGYWASLERLKNAKGLLYFNLISTDKNQYRKQDGTTPEYYLQCQPPKSKTVNFSGIRFQYYDGVKTLFASGEPSVQEKLKSGVVNPMFDNKNDAFLFIFSEDMERLEVLIVDCGRVLIDAYCKQLSNGMLDDVLEALRQQAKTVTSYSKL